MRTTEIIVPKIKERIKRKIDKIYRGKTRRDKEFLSEILIGILTSKDVKLSEIGRGLKEEIKIDYTIKRMSRHINKEDYSKGINETMLRETTVRQSGKEIIAVDFSDIIKPNAVAMENLAGVHDGSENKTGKGYNLLLCSRIQDNRMELMYSELFSTKEEHYQSYYSKVEKVLDQIKANSYGKPLGTIVMDRGFDDKKYYKYFNKNGIEFIVRLRKNRKVKESGKWILLEKLYSRMTKQNYIGKVIYEREKRKSRIGIGYTKVQIEGIKGEYNLIVIESEYYAEPMYLLTNRKCNSKESAKKIYEMYLKRWGIEQIIRAMKEEYNLEDVRVLKYKALKNMISFVALVMYLVGKIVYEVGNNTKYLKRQIISISKRIKKTGHFLYYAVSDGISSILKNIDKKIIFYPIKFNGDLPLFAKKSG
jgi:hypothetical protein